MSREGTSAGTVMVAFALGALAGAAIALLYAPASGEETRRKVADKAREGRDRAEEAVREGREFLRRQSGKVAEAIDRGAEAFNQVRKDAL